MTTNKKPKIIKQIYFDNKTKNIWVFNIYIKRVLEIAVAFECVIVSVLTQKIKKLRKRLNKRLGKKPLVFQKQRS